jgi:hypothetical protein
MVGGARPAIATISTVDRRELNAYLTIAPFACHFPTYIFYDKSYKRLAASHLHLQVSFTT